MLYFPQLGSGGTAQYPIQKRYSQRTVINRCEDGHVIKLLDPTAAGQQWQLTLRDLTDSEITTIQQFFVATEGRLNAFTFLDPMNNLLMWSEALDQAAWQKSSLLQIQTGIDDPAGGSNAAHIVNPTGADLTVQQTVNVPGWYVYCLSAYIRSERSSNVSLQVLAGTDSDSYSIPGTSQWQRLTLTTRANTPTGSLIAGIVIPAGQSADAFGAQLEAQPGASAYRRTTSTSGVIPSAHFGQDTLTFTTDGPNRHHCNLTIVAP